MPPLLVEYTIKWRAKRAFMFIWRPPMILPFIGRYSMIKEPWEHFYLQPITRNSFHFPFLNRIQNSKARSPQSRHMAKATPITHRFIQIPKITEKTTLQKIVEKILTYIVNFTSPAARRPLERAPERG